MKHVKEHYDNHLGHFYSWMVGDFDEKQREQEAYFVRNAIHPSYNRKAIDLGAGHGLQSVSLARLGFEVLAVDFNRQLLEELTERSKGLKITAVHGDIKDFGLFDKYDPELAVCIGDTITHLHSEEEVKKLCEKMYELLLPGGKFIISYRDFANELRSSERLYRCVPMRTGYIPASWNISRIMLR